MGCETGSPTRVGRATESKEGLGSGVMGGNSWEGPKMISLVKGDKFKSVFTGRIYAVRIIGDRLVLLESDDKLSRVLTRRDYLKSFYQTVAYEDRPEVAR